MYGNLEHIKKVDNAHYFTIDIDVSGKSFYIETAFLSNFQYNPGDTAFINDVAYELIGTPGVTKLFGIYEMCTACIDMKNKKLICVDTHKASFDTFLVYNSMSEVDTEITLSSSTMVLMSKTLAVPLDAEGNEIITDVKLGASAYFNRQYSYEPEYGSGTTQRPASTMDTAYSNIKTGSFKFTIDGNDYKYHFTVTHRNDSIVEEMTIPLKSGDHSIQITFDYTSGAAFNQNALTAYIMGSNLVESVACPFVYACYGVPGRTGDVTSGELGAVLLAPLDRYVKEIKIPDYIAGTDIPIINFNPNTYNSGVRWSYLKDSSWNNQAFQRWNPEWGTGVGGADQKLVIQNTLDNNYYLNNAFYSTGCMPYLERVILGKNIMYFSIRDWYQYSDSTAQLYQGFPTIDYSKCKGIKVLAVGAYSSAGYNSSYGTRKLGAHDIFVDEDGYTICTIKMDPEDAVISASAVVLNHMDGTMYFCRGYNGTYNTEIHPAIVEILGNTNRLVYCPNNSYPVSSTTYSSYNYSCMPIKLFHITAKNFIVSPYLSDQIYTNSFCNLPPREYNLRTQYLKATYSLSGGTTYHQAFNDDLYLHGSTSPSTNSLAIPVFFTHAKSLTDREDITYQFDGNVIFPESGASSSTYFLFMSIKPDNGNYWKMNSSAPIKINHRLVVNVEGHVHFISVYGISNYNTGCADRYFCSWEPRTSYTSPTSLTRYGWFNYSSGTSTTRTDGEYWCDTTKSCADPVHLFHMKSNGYSMYLYHNVWAQDGSTDMKKVDLKLNINGTFFNPGAQWYFDSSQSSGAFRPTDPYFLDYVNHPEDVEIVHIKGDYFGYPYFFSLSKQVYYRTPIAGYGMSTHGGGDSLYLNRYAAGTTFSDPCYGAVLKSSNNNFGNPLRPYQVTIEGDAVFGQSNSAYSVSIGAAVYFRNLLYSYYAYYDNSDISTALKTIGIYHNWLATTGHGTLNFEGFEDGAVLDYRSFNGAILPRDFTLDLRNVAVIGKEALSCCIMSGDIIWPTEEEPAEWMSPDMFNVSSYYYASFNWNVVDRFHEKLSDPELASETQVFISPADTWPNVVLPDIDFNAHIIGIPEAGISYRKPYLAVPTNRICLDEIYEELKYEITHDYIKWDDPLFISGDHNCFYCIQTTRNTDPPQSGANYLFNLNSPFASNYPGYLFSTTAELTMDEYNTKYLNGYTSYTECNWILKMIALAEAGVIQYSDIRIPHYTIGKCAKHIATGAFFGKPVYCAVGDDANYQFKTIELPNIVTIGDLAFAFDVWRDLETKEHGIGYGLTKTVICGDDLRWIGINPDINEFVIPETNTHLIVENGYIYSADKTILFRAQNNAAIMATTITDTPITLPNTIKLIVDGRMLKYDQRIRELVFDNTQVLNTNMTSLPPNITNVVIPSNTTLSIESLPAGCSFSIINTGGTSKYYMPTDGLASEVYAPATTTMHGWYIEANSSQSSAIVSSMSPVNYDAEPFLVPGFGYTGTDPIISGYRSNMSSAQAYWPINFYAESNWPDINNPAVTSSKLALMNKNALVSAQDYMVKYNSYISGTAISGNYNIIYFRPNTEGDTRINLDVKCKLLDVGTPIDILGIHSEMDHPIYMKANIGSFAIVSGSTENYTVSDDGKSLYYKGVLIKVANSEAIDEYHVTTRIWPGAFYGCTIDKVYIDITAPEISVTCPLGSRDGTNIGKECIPCWFDGLFSGAMINKLYFNFADIGAMWSPLYSTAKTIPACAAIPIERMRDNAGGSTTAFNPIIGKINEIHVSGVTQALIDEWEPIDVNPWYMAIPWFLLGCLSQGSTAYSGWNIYEDEPMSDYPNWNPPTVYLDGATDVKFNTGAKNACNGIIFADADNLYSNIQNGMYAGSAPSVPIHRDNWSGTARNNTWNFYALSNTMVYGEGRDLVFDYCRFQEHGCAIYGHPNSLTIKRTGYLGDDRLTFRNAYAHCPEYWYNADSVVVDEVLMDMRINTPEKLNKVTFDLSELEEAKLRVSRAGFARGRSYDNYVEDYPMPSRYNYLKWIPYLRDWDVRPVLYTGAITDAFKQALATKVTSNDVYSGRSTGPDYNYIHTSLKATADEMLAWLRSIPMYAFFGVTLNFDLLYPDGTADFVVEPFDNIERHMMGEYNNYAKYDSNNQYWGSSSRPHIAMCFTPCKNTRYTTFNPTTRDMTINVPEGLTTEQFLELWCNERIETHRFDSITFNSNYYIDWRVFQHSLDTLYEYEESLEYNGYYSGYTYLHYYRERMHGPKYIWFKKIVINTYPLYYEADKGEESTNLLNNSFETKFPKADLKAACPLYILGTYDNYEDKESTVLRYGNTFPWTEVVVNTDFAILTFEENVDDMISSNMSGSYRDMYEIGGSFKKLKMTDMRWNDLDHLHKYIMTADETVESVDSDLEPKMGIRTGVIMVKDLSFAENCKKLVLINCGSSLVIRHLNFTQFDYVYLDTTCSFAYGPFETVVIHNITPKIGSCIPYKMKYNVVNDSDVKSFQSWFKYAQLTSVELMFELTEFNAWLDFIRSREVSTTMIESYLLNIFHGTFSCANIGTFKTNIPLMHWHNIFYKAQHIGTIIVNTLSDASRIGISAFQQYKENPLAITVQDINGNTDTLFNNATILEEYAFDECTIPVDTLTLPNVTKVDNNALAHLTGPTELVLPQCTYFRMSTGNVDSAGTVRQIKVKTGCDIQCPDHVLVIFI